LNVRIKFYAYLRDIFVTKEKEIELDSGASLADLLDILCSTPERRKEIYDGHRLKPHLVIFKNGVNILNIGGLAVELKDGDILNIFPFIGGG